MARVLVADDEESVREFVTRALELAGHRVTGVADGGAAIDALGAAGPGAYDLLVSDIRMPVMDGIALALKAKAAYPGLHIIMMTGFSDELERAYNLDAIIEAVIQKPMTLDALQSLVAETLSS